MMHDYRSFVLNQLIVVVRRRVPFELDPSLIILGCVPVEPPSSQEFARVDLVPGGASPRGPGLG